MDLSGFIDWLSWQGTSERSLPAYRIGAELFVAEAKGRALEPSHVKAVISEQRYTGAPEQRLENLRIVAHALGQFLQQHPDGRFVRPATPPPASSVRAAAPSIAPAALDVDPVHGLPLPPPPSPTALPPTPTSPPTSTSTPTRDRPPLETPFHDPSLSAPAAPPPWTQLVTSRSATDVAKCIRCGRMEPAQPGAACSSCGTLFPMIRSINYVEPTDVGQQIAKALPAAAVVVGAGIGVVLVLATFLAPMLSEEWDSPKLDATWWIVRFVGVVMVSFATLRYYLTRDPP